MPSVPAPLQTTTNVHNQDGVDHNVCEDFPNDLSYISYNPQEYEEQLQEKIKRVLQDFERHLSPSMLPQNADDPRQQQDEEAASFHLQPVMIFRSPTKYHRLRIKLNVIRDEKRGILSYVMWDKEKQYVPLQTFPLASERINLTMPILLSSLQGSDKLQHGLRAVKFLDTYCQKGRLLVSLIYQTPVDESWEQEARRLLHGKLDLQVIGRSRGIKICVDTKERDRVLEEFVLRDQDQRVSVRYKQIEGSFSNPNGHMAISTLEWLLAVTDVIITNQQALLRGEKKIDLLELYCGNGHHTVALSRRFSRVIGVEINQHLVQIARENLALNGIGNAQILARPSEKLSRKFLDAQGWDCRVILVDPPRAGLDLRTRQLASQFEEILYISCGPSSLLRDLEGLDDQYKSNNPRDEMRRRKLKAFGKGLLLTHEIVHLAILDHFPYTRHIEVGVHLRKRKTTK